jgi:hypothetical protein
MLNFSKVRVRATVAVGAAAIIAGGFAVVGSHTVLAGYTNDCSTVDGGSPVPAVGPVHVYTSSRVGAPVGAGVCVDPTAGAGGDLEVGANPTGNGQIDGISGLPGVYAVLDGNDNNPTVGPVGTSGYVGISDYETDGYTPYAGDDSGCGPVGGSASGSNSGGAFMAKPLCPTYHTVTGQYGLPLPIACGFNSGPDWDNTQRDGCFFP